MKTCKHCTETKDFSFFSVNKGNRGGYAHKCKVCRAEEARLLRKGESNTKPSKARLSIEERVKRHNAWAANHRDYQNNYDIFRRYGITLEDRKAMFDQQKGLCSICNKSGDFVIDHCHKTGKIRSLIHRNCNSALGLIKEDFDMAIGLAKYIQEHKGTI